MENHIYNIYREVYLYVHNPHHTHTTPLIKKEAKEVWFVCVLQDNSLADESRSSSFSCHVTLILYVCVCMFRYVLFFVFIIHYEMAWCPHSLAL